MYDNEQGYAKRERVYYTHVRKTREKIKKIACHVIVNHDPEAPRRLTLKRSRFLTSTYCFRIIIFLYPKFLNNFSLF